MKYITYRTYSLLKISLFILFIKSLYAWFLWEDSYFSFLLSLIAIAIFTITNKGALKFKRENITPIALIIVLNLYLVRELNINGFIFGLLTGIILSFVLLLKDQIKSDLFKFFTTAFSILLFISLFAWLLFIFGVNLPHYPLEHGTEQYRYYHHNYYYFLYDTADHEKSGVPIPRFSSIFIEPGQLGMMTSFFLYGNQFELKRKSILIILIATLLTFSLAAYVVLIISVTIYVLLKSNKPILLISLWAIFLAICYFYFTSLNHGNNIINKLIIDRLQITDNGIAGDNRVSLYLDSYFDNFKTTGETFFGLGDKKYSEIDWGGGNAGYKVFWLRHGIVGILLVFIFYLSIVIGNSSKMAWSFLLIYILIFIQAAYATWVCELLLFITATPTFKYYSQKNTP